NQVVYPDVEEKVASVRPGIEYLQSLLGEPRESVDMHRMTVQAFYISLAVVVLLLIAVGFSFIRYTPRVAQQQPNDINLALGFGAVVTRESRQRFLNRDGSFNVRREGLSFWQELSPYHYVVTMSWPKFLAFIAVRYSIA